MWSCTARQCAASDAILWTRAAWAAVAQQAHTVYFIGRRPTTLDSYCIEKQNRLIPHSGSAFARAAPHRLPLPFAEGRAEGEHRSAENRNAAGAHQLRQPASGKTANHAGHG